MGRPNKYETHVKPKFKEIKEWLSKGISEKDIAEKLLGVSQTRYFEYKNKYREFRELFKNSRSEPVEMVKSALLKKATGFQYTERKVVTKHIECDNGEQIVPAKEVTTETYYKQALPDTSACLILLKHWDKETGWTSDPQMLELKKQEFELKKLQAENENW